MQQKNKKVNAVTVVWIHRRKKLFYVLRKELSLVMKELVRQKESEIEAGNLLPDHVHMLISIPPKYSVASVVGYIKGKSAIYVARNFRGIKKNFKGGSFWARGYYVSTIGLDDEAVRQYIENQYKEDQRLVNLSLLIQ